MKKNRLLFFFTFIGLVVASITASAMSGKIKGPNRAPVADAGFDQIVEPYYQVVLDGSKSFDPDGDKLTYEWDLVAAPEGGKAKLTGDKSMISCFLPNKTGVWVVRLTVSDRRLKSESDVIQVRVKLPELSQLPGPVPTQPDFKIIKIAALGVHNNKYVDDFRVKVENTGSDYSGALDFRIVGIDQLRNGKFTLDKRLVVNDSYIRRGEEKWLTLMKQELEWPEEVRKITFALIVDPENKINELNENNNYLERTIHRFNLLPCCNVGLSDKITINGRMIRKGQRYTFPIKSYGTMIGINLINCCGKSKTSELHFVYDWTPLKPDGENILIQKSEITLNGGEKYIRFDGLRIPRKEKYKKNYTIFAIIRHHENGYDVLYETPVRADYVKIVGK